MPQPDTILLGRFRRNGVHRSALSLAKRSVILCFAGLLLAACESIPEQNRISEEPPLPSQYRNALSSSVREALDQPMDLAWWMDFGSQELDRLVDRGLANNPDLRIATLQIAQAKIRADQAQAGRLPNIGASGSAAAQNSGGDSNSRQSSQLSLQGSWRLDIWGEQSALVESADLQVLRAVHSRENVQRNMISGLVTAYIAYLSANDSIVFARENEKVSRDILKNIEARASLGDATADELEHQRANVFAIEAIIPRLENEREDIRNAIARLVGTVPGNLVLSETGVDGLLTPEIKVGLPATLLLRRPDIRMVEARMRSAKADIEVARARLLPPIDLSAQAGFSGLSLAQLFQPQSFILNSVASLAATIFDGGRRDGERAFAQAYYEELIAIYGQSIFQAIREVESAVANLRSTSLRLDAQKRVTRSALNLFRIGSEAYSLGSIDLTTLLESRKAYQRNVDETQRMKAELLRSQVGLAQALGAGGLLDEISAGNSQKQSVPGSARIPFVIKREDGLTLSDNQQSEARQVLAVELPGSFHQSAIVPVWRDLNSRFAIAMNKRLIRAVQQGKVNGEGGTVNAWYRLYVVGFEVAPDADAFCSALNERGQGCVSTSVSKTAALPETRAWNQ